MTKKPQVAIVGPGRLGTTMAQELARAGYRVREIISHDNSQSKRIGARLAKAVRARPVTIRDARLDAQLVWFCVPDREISAAARELAPLVSWEGKVAFHASGALASDELQVLRRRGAAVASVHPLMTFVRGSSPQLQGVPFGVEGDATASRVARRVVSNLGGEVFKVPKNRKAEYHAWGAFLSPLLIALLVTAEEIARRAGISAKDARRRALPIVAQTLANYAALGPAGAFSGPLVRGDAAVVRKHLSALKRIPEVRTVYVALAKAAIKYLPVGEREELQEVLKNKT